MRRERAEQVQEKESDTAPRRGSEVAQKSGGGLNSCALTFYVPVGLRGGATYGVFLMLFR